MNTQKSVEGRKREGLLWNYLHEGNISFFLGEKFRKLFDSIQNYSVEKDQVLRGKSGTGRPMEGMGHGWSRPCSHLAGGLGQVTTKQARTAVS